MRIFAESHLDKFEGADHSFKAGKNDVISLLVNETKKWVEKIYKLS
jgi:hypothetical protein